MNTALPVLFALAALCSIAAMWQAVKSNLDVVLDLRRRVALPHHGCEVVVNLREPMGELDPVAAMRRPRQIRVPAPKPVTHRLHQFIKTRTVA
jgi:hypothetical protein